MKKRFLLILLSVFVSMSYASITVGARTSVGYGLDVDGNPSGQPVFGISGYCEIGFIDGDFVENQFAVRPEISTAFAYSPLTVKLPLVWIFEPKSYIDLGVGAGPMFSFFKGGFGFTADAFLGFKAGPGKVVIDLCADFTFSKPESAYIQPMVALGYQYRVY